MGASTHPRIDIKCIAARNERSEPRCLNKCQRGGRLCHQRHPPRRFALGVRLCSVPTEQRRTSHDGRKDLGSFLPSCIEWLCLVRTRQSHLMHDGRKDPRSFLPSFEEQEGREDRASSFPSCKVNFILQCVDWCSHPSTH